MTRKVIIIILAYFLIIFFESCDPYGCGDTHVQPFFKVIGLDNPTISNGESIVDTLGTVKASHLHISFNYEVEFYDAEEAYAPLFSNKLIACSPMEPGYEGSAQILSNFTITTNTDFFDYKKGDTITHLFKINNQKYEDFKNKNINEKVRNTWNYIDFDNASFTGIDTLGMNIIIELDNYITYTRKTHKVIVN